MPSGRWAAATVAVACGVAPAAQAAAFRIPPGSVGEVVAALGVQARITIAVTDAEIAARRSPGVRGDVSIREALRRALKGTDAEAVFYDAATVRIVRKPTSVPAPRPPSSPTPARPTDIDEIVVTASKQNMLLDRYPGSATVVDFATDRLARDAHQGTAAITGSLPTLSATNLGRGRNKLYVRGVSDSSFNGPSQATVGQYLGDVRLNYSAPDPDLNLYDMARVEVLAGPQGTLYGASSLGGIVRLVPNAPDPTTLEASASAGLSTTRFGGVGRDAAAMLNVPLADGRAAARLVIYATRDAGYVDDPSRGLRDINSGRSVGGRLAWRMDDLRGWQVDFGGVLQDVGADDGQYTRRGFPPLTRASAIAQPFRSEYRLGHLTGRRSAWGSELLTTTSVVEHDLATVFDATGSVGVPRRFEEVNDILLVSHETRLSGGEARTPWVMGLAGVYSVSRLTRTLGPPDAPEQIAGVRNRQIEVSVFGQASRRLGSRFTATAGARLTGAGTTGRLLDATDALQDEYHGQVRLIPMVGLDWRISRSLSAFTQFQQGFRAGGFAVPSAGSGEAGEAFRADNLGQVEVGLRWRSPQHSRLSGRLAAIFIDWDHIQADLVDDAGLPYTDNIGSGRIYGADVEATWRPTPDLRLAAAAFFNNTYLFDAPPGLVARGKHTLPNIPRDGVRGEIAWRRELGGGAILTADASLRYVGKSFLATGSSYDVAQGKYFVAGAGARIDFGRFAVSLDLANIGDARGNTFAFGNPFGLTQRNQVTPLRPRTLRLGIDTRF